MTGRSWPLFIGLVLVVGLAAAGLLLTPVLKSSDDPGYVATGLAADHHLHIRSATIGELLQSQCSGMTAIVMGCEKDNLHRDITAEELIALLDRNGVEQGLALSMAYLSGMPELGISGQRQREITRAENSYISRQVSAAPDRLTGFFSVNPLTPHAEDEVRYWARHGSLKGLKLHLANSDVDLRDQQHLLALRRVFAILDDTGLSALVHLRNRNKHYGRADVEAFIKEVFAPTTAVHLTVAHFAGWGGYGKGTDEAAAAFQAAFEAGALDRSRVTFDLSGTVLADGTAFNPIALFFRLSGQNNTALLLARIRSIGVDRIVFGSDWNPDFNAPIVAEPAPYARAFARIGLSETEFETILSNRAPYLP